MLMPRHPSSFPSSTEGPHGSPPACRPSFSGSGSQASGTKHGGTALLMYPVPLAKGWFSNVWPLLAPFVRAGSPMHQDLCLLPALPTGAPRPLPNP